MRIVNKNRYRLLTQEKTLLNLLYVFKKLYTTNTKNKE